MYDDYFTRVIEPGGDWGHGRSYRPKRVVSLGYDNGAAYALVFLATPLMFKFRFSTKCIKSGPTPIRIREPKEHATPDLHENLQFHSACWDSYTNCVFAALGYAVVRVAENGDATVVAGHPTRQGTFTAQEGCLDGTGLHARFQARRNCNDLVSDGEGCLYLLDSGRLRRLQLPAAWRAAATEGDGAAVAAQWGFPGAEEEENEEDEEDEEDKEQQQQQQGGDAAGSSAAKQAPAAGVPAMGPRPRPLPAGEVVVTTVCCGALDRRLRWQAYDPASRSLVLCTRRAVYRLPVAGLGAASHVHDPVLVAGNVARRWVHSADGVGTEAHFIWIEGVAVDGTGSAWTLESDMDPFRDPERRSPDDSELSEVELDLIELQLRRVRPNGKVTTVAESEKWRGGRDDGPNYAMFGSAPTILHNGWLAVVSRYEEGVLLVQMGLTPPGVAAAAGPSPRDPCPAAGTLSSDLGELLDRQPDGSTDVEVEVGGQVFAAHRTVLAARSPYFRQRLDPGAGFADAGGPRLSLPDADPGAFAAVLRYMYTDSAGPVPPELLQPVGELADRLLLPGLCAQVGSQLLGRVCAESVVGLLLWAEQRSSFEVLLSGLKEWFTTFCVPQRGGILSLEELGRLQRESPSLAQELLPGGEQVGHEGEQKQEQQEGEERDEEKAATDGKAQVKEVDGDERGLKRSRCE